jgi:hypothetical protein
MLARTLRAVRYPYFDQCIGREQMICSEEVAFSQGEKKRCDVDPGSNLHQHLGQMELGGLAG